MWRSWTIPQPAPSSQQPAPSSQLPAYAVSGYSPRSHVDPVARCGQPAASARKMRCRRAHPRRRRFAPVARPTRMPNRWCIGVRSNPAEAATVRPAPEAHFSGRRPRRRGGDVAPRRAHTLANHTPSSFSSYDADNLQTTPDSQNVRVKVRADCIGVGSWRLGVTPSLPLLTCAASVAPSSQPGAFAGSWKLEATSRLPAP
jgi:hypothetical protein